MVSFTKDPKVVGGLFGIVKPDGSIRLVFDGRRSNQAWSTSPKVELISPEHLARLEVPTDKTLFVCKDDIDNYYHRLVTPEWMHPYFALPLIRASDVGLEKIYGDELIFPCLTTLPMGC